MTRGTCIAVLLLVASNAAWWIASWSAGPAADRLALEQAEQGQAGLAQTVERLRAPVRVLRAQDGLEEGGAPGLSGRAGREPAEAAAAGSSDAPAGGDAVPGPEEQAAAEQRRAAAAKDAGLRERMIGTLKKILQVQDAGLRDEGLVELRIALSDADPRVLEFALGTLFQLDKVDLDTHDLRAQVLGLLDAPTPGVRRSALYALHTTGVEAGDRERVLAAAHDEDPLVRQHAARVLALYDGGRFEGEAAAVLAALLQDDDRDVRRGTLRALENARVPPSVDERLLALAAQPAERRETLQYGLAPLADKSRAVVDALLGYLDDSDQRVRAQAHQGLQRGIRPQDESAVARGYAEHLATFLSPRSHREALKVIARFGDAALAPAIEAFARNELVDAQVREMAAQVAEILRAK